MDIFREVVEFIDPELAAGLLFLLTTIVGAVSAAAAKTQDRLRDNAVQLIGRAEEKYADQEKAGSHKHAYVVDKLRGQIPMAIRPLFSQGLLDKLVDHTFVAVSRYSATQAVCPPREEAPAPEPCPPQPTPILEERRDETDVPKTDTASQQMSGNRILQNGGLQSAVRVFTLRGRHGLLFRAEYGVCQRRRFGAGHRRR